MKTRPISSYRTFARGGYIIRIKPTAIGMDVVPMLIAFERVGKSRYQVAEANAERHGDEDPQRQVTVEK